MSSPWRPWEMTPMPEPQSVRLARLVRDVQAEEHRHLLHGDRRNPVTLPWMPYQPADFIGIIWECLPELKAAPIRFLDVGCGPGTKMRIAHELFGLDAWGVEIDAEMAATARKLSGSPQRVRLDDAAALPGEEFEPFDIIWLYRPLRDPLAEWKLEGHILRSMKPGAIIAGASWETDVPSMGWQPVVDDCLISPDGSSQIIRGAWQKPLAA